MQPEEVVDKEEKNLLPQLPKNQHGTNKAFFGGTW